MKKTATIITTALTATLMLCALTGGATFAKPKIHMAKIQNHMISFTQTTMVNGTSVKAGEYQAKFDEQSGQLTILNESNHVIATAKAHENALNKKAAGTSYELKSSGDKMLLERVVFAGSNYAIALDDTMSGGQ